MEALTPRAKEAKKMALQSQRAQTRSRHPRGVEGAPREDRPVVGKGKAMRMWSKAKWKAQWGASSKGKETPAWKTP